MEHLKRHSDFRVWKDEKKQLSRGGVGVDSHEKGRLVSMSEDLDMTQT